MGRFMAKVNVKIKKLAVKRVDLIKGYLSLFLEYAVDDSSERIDKEFRLEENAINFSIQYLREIKELVKKRYPSIFALEFDKGEENARDSLVMALRKMLERVAELKATSNHEQYLKMFHAVNSMQIEIR